MASDFGEYPELNAMARRLRELVKKAGGNQRVADAAEVPLSTLNTILAGKTDPRLSTLRKLAPALGVPISVLVEPDSGEDPTIFRISEDRVAIPMRDYPPGHWPEEDPARAGLAGHWQLPASLARSWNRPLAGIEAVQMQGDAMWPTLSAGQWVLIDRAERDLAEGQIHAFATPDGLRFRRFQRAMDGTALLVADHREVYAPERLGAEALPKFSVFGRAFLTLRMV